MLERAREFLHEVHARVPPDDGAVVLVSIKRSLE